tara:strand:+ start:6978 stop:7349 length:372 start_codon:yes stop_codon:yes gene_type:complete
MKTLISVILSLLLFSTAVYVSTPPVEEAKICTSGVCVVEFNANFNQQNAVPWIEQLNDCETGRVDIASSPDMQQRHKIVVVPTIVVFNEGEEITRFQANIMMTMEATETDVQDAIDEIILSDF